MHVLINASKDSKQWEILSTHPDPERRLTDVMQAIKTEFPETQNNPKYKRFENRFEHGAAPYLNLKKKSASAGARTGVMPPETWCAHCRAAAEWTAVLAASSAPALPSIAD